MTPYPRMRRWTGRSNACKNTGHEDHLGSTQNISRLVCTQKRGKTHQHPPTGRMLLLWYRTPSRRVILRKSAPDRPLSWSQKKTRIYSALDWWGSSVIKWQVSWTADWCWRFSTMTPCMGSAWKDALGPIPLKPNCPISWNIWWRKYNLR